MKTRFAFALLGFWALLLGACSTSTWRGADEHIYFDPSDKTIFYRDAWVQRNPPEVHVRPASLAPAGARVLFLPFRVTQPMENPTVLGYTSARTMWQTWLTMQIFPAMEFSGDDTPYRRDRAVELGRARGADMVIGGFVTYVYAGGTAGDSQMAVQVEAHDTRSGQLVWSMAQSGLIPGVKKTDYFLFATKTRLPSDPLHAIVQAMASDMGRELQNWISGPAPLSRMEKLDKDAHGALFAPPDSVPAPRGRPEAPSDSPYNPKPQSAL